METENENPLDIFTEEGSVPSPLELNKFNAAVRPITDVGEYKSEDDDPNVLIFGPWLERGGSAFWVSTAGTGKSIGSIQLAYSMTAGYPFCGLKPRGKLRFWIFQSEDSPRRVAQDCADVAAELAERYPSEDWAKIGKQVKMVSLTGAVGVKFLAELNGLLAQAGKMGEKPDVIILNPLLAFVGGPITDGSYVTPFLRGGEIGYNETEGLQAILERHKVGVLIFHHTPKPPTEKEIDSWMKSPFPEYQGAGSSDLTNWGRSFVTMMRVKGHPNMVCVTAGKNGAELGWEQVSGAYRRYMAYSDGEGVSGKGRHAWRDLTEDEYEEVVGGEKKEAEKAVEDIAAAVAEAIKERRVAVKKSEIEKTFAGKWSRKELRLAKATLVAHPGKYGLTIEPALLGRSWTDFIGQAESLRRAKKACEEAGRYEEAMEAKRAESAEKAQNVEAVGPTVAAADGQPDTETPQEGAEGGWF